MMMAVKTSYAPNHIGRRLLLAILGSLLLPFVVFAGNIYVDIANQSGTEDGTLAFPYNTIQEGITNSLDGDTVMVAPGSTMK
jgi:hypothetical protein